MILRNKFQSIILLLSMVLLSGCVNPNPQPSNLTPIPTLAQVAKVTLEPAIIGAKPSTEQPSIVMEEAQAAIGAGYYFERCTICHGVRGEGIDAPALRNNQFIQPNNDLEVFNTIANGRTDSSMPAWLQANGGPFTEGYISDIVIYLHSLQGVAALPTATPLPPQPTETPPPENAPTPEPARPSNPGEPGPAVGLTGDMSKGQPSFGLYCAVCHGPQGFEEMGRPNPGSDDGIVPQLNPIDPTLVNQDKTIFAENLDLFIEHGSVPSGDSPRIMMPIFGDDKLLTPQQIADIIAYLIYLNGGK